MECPRCKEEMEFEEIKNFCGVWTCCECDVEYDGEMIPCDSDGISITDVEEKIYS